MRRVYESSFLDPSERARVERLEIVDELEEWSLLMDHYCLCLAPSSAEAARDVFIRLAADLDPAFAHSDP